MGDDTAIHSGGVHSCSNTKRLTIFLYDRGLSYAEHLASHDINFFGALQEISNSLCFL